MLLRRPSASHRLARAAIAISATAGVLLPAESRAADVEVCIEAFESAQVLQDQGRLVESWDAFSSCAAVDCPSSIQSECRAGLSELRPLLPTLSLRARDPEGRDVPEVEVHLDGSLWAVKLNGQARAVNPGEHLFVFQAPGYREQRLTLVVREGERGRLVDTVLQKKVVTRATEAGGASSKDLTLAWTSASVGLAGVATFALLGLIVENNVAELRRNCAPSCPASDIEDTLTLATVANVGLGVGALGIGAATWLFLRPGLPAPPAGSGARASGSAVPAASPPGARSFGGAGTPAGVPWGMTCEVRWQ